MTEITNSQYDIDPEFAAWLAERFPCDPAALAATKAKITARVSVAIGAFIESFARRPDGNEIEIMCAAATEFEMLATMAPPANDNATLQ